MKIIIIRSFIAFLVASSVDDAIARTSAGTLFSKSKCIKIPRSFSFCYGHRAAIPYNVTRLPNLLGQDTVDEIAGLLPAWDPLLKINCHPRLALFLCSLYAPLCVDSYDEHVKPCKELCQEVQSDCVPVMNQFSYDWPEKMNCEQFPLSGNMCFNGTETSHSEPEEKICKACRKLDTIESWQFEMCRSKLFIKGKVGKIKNYGKNHVMISIKKKHKVIRSTMKLSGKRLPSDKLKNFRIRNIQDCTCNGLEPGSKKKAKLFFIQPHKSRDELYVTTIVEYNRRDPVYKEAVRKLKEGGGCKVVMEKYHASKD